MAVGRRVRRLRKSTDILQHYDSKTYMFFESIFDNISPWNREYLKPILVVCMVTYATFFASFHLEFAFMTDEEHQYEKYCSTPVFKNSTVEGINFQALQMRRKVDIHQDPLKCRICLHILTIIGTCVIVGWRWPRYLFSTTMIGFLTGIAVGGSGLTAHNSFTETSLGFLVVEFCSNVCYILCTELLVASLPKRMRELGMLLATISTALAMVTFVLVWKVLGPQYVPIFSGIGWLFAFVLVHWLGSESLQSMVLYTKTQKLKDAFDAITKFGTTHVSAVGIFDVMLYGGRVPEPTTYPEALEMAASNSELVKQLLFHGFLLFFTRAEMTHDNKYGPTYTMNMPFPLFFTYLYIGCGTVLFTFVLAKFGRRRTMEISLAGLAVYYSIIISIPIESYDECQGRFLNYLGANTGKAVLERGFAAVIKQFLLLLWGGSIGMLHLCARLALSEACPQIIRVFVAALSHSLIQMTLFIPTAYIIFLESLGHVILIYITKIFICTAFFFFAVFYVHELPQAVLTFHELNTQRRIWEEQEERIQGKKIKNDLQPASVRVPPVREPTHQELYP